MKTQLLCTLSLAGLLVALPAAAQVYTPPSGGGSGAPAGGGAQPGNTTTIVNQGGNQPQGNQQMAGNDVPYFDPTTDVFSFDGKNFNVNDNRVLRARFEKYLNAEEASSEADIAYRASLREILDTLSPHNRDVTKFPKAVAMLQYTAQFPQDARLCESLANAVYRVYLAQRSQSELQTLNTQLDDQRRQLDWNFDTWTKPSNIRKERKLSDDPQAADPPAVNPANAGHIQRYVQRIAEVEAERVANKAKGQLSEIEAKLEFQALVVQFFLQRRFEHVVMATRFYTEFFKDGAGKLEFEEGSEVEQSFSKTIGFNPTITTLDAFANEAIRDVGQSVESFGFLLDQGEIDGAMRQLQQAFVTGEHLPSVQSVPRERKRLVLTYAQNSFQLVNAIEVKDYALAEKLVTDMKTQAGDFDYSKPTAAIETAKLSSNMRIRTAKNAALQGDNEAYESNILAAAQIWPTNPMLQEQFNLIADSADVQQQAKLEFDRLLSTQSYRQIFTDKARYMAATAEDPERLKALEQIVGNIQEIETVMKQADTLAKAGNNYAAWEIVEKTFQRFPDDVALSAKRSDFATDVATFVKALKNAENQENRKQFGSGLAWFLSARQIYPQSEFAEEGIKRLIDNILPEEGGAVGNGGGSSAGEGDSL
ncbi:MAG: hypothetical protein NWT04_10745 [Verrucomicrobiales bacterium]|jgi:hypothetical protein|nr:hypothetical protein [Verrucomicrobiales bacterium]MDP4793689.1 hypothetical protein [Verrucomicrobiales bacterium]MDP5004544.1 hypothetical protein [Verrucomicrobiales bacterium]